MLAHRVEPEPLDDAPLGASQVGAGNDGRAAPQQLGQRGHRSSDAKVLGDSPVLHGNVEVTPDQDSLPAERPQILQRTETAQSLEATSAARSTRRFE